MVDTIRQECRGRLALCRGSGCPRTNPFLSFCLPPAAAREEKEVSGDSPDPGRENPAPLQNIPHFRGHYPTSKNGCKGNFSHMRKSGIDILTIIPKLVMLKNKDIP